MGGRERRCSGTWQHSGGTGKSPFVLRVQGHLGLLETLLQDTKTEKKERILLGPESEEVLSQELDFLCIRRPWVSPFEEFLFLNGETPATSRASWPSFMPWGWLTSPGSRSGLSQCGLCLDTRYKRWAVDSNPLESTRCEGSHWTTLACHGASSVSAQSPLSSSYRPIIKPGITKSLPKVYISWILSKYSPILIWN